MNLLLRLLPAIDISGVRAIVETMMDSADVELRAMLEECRSDNSSLSRAICLGAEHEMARRMGNEDEELLQMGKLLLLAYGDG